MAYRDLVLNGSFENDSAWTFSSPAQIVPGNAYIGSRCVQFGQQGSGENPIVYSQPIQVVPGNTYELSFYAKAQGPMDMWARAQITFGSTILYLNSPSYQSQLTTSYNKYTWTFTVPSTANNTISILLHASVYYGQTATAWLDNVQLMGDDGSQEQHPPGTSILPNGSFETNDGWSFQGSAEYLTDAANAKIGNRCLHITSSANGSSQYAYETVTMTPGTEYILSFFGKVTGGIVPWAFFTYFNAGNYTTMYAPTFTQVSSSYINYQWRFTFPATASSTSAAMHLFGRGTGSSGTAWIDDAVLVPADGGATEPFTVGNFVMVNATNARLRKSPSNQGERQCYLQPGAKFIINDTVTADGYTWIEIKWGGESANVMYLREDVVEDCGYGPESALNGIIEIANSLVESGYYTGDDLGLSGDWCQKFLSFLCKAVGVSTGAYPPHSTSLCSQGISFFDVLFQYEEITAETPPPVQGNWVYYRDTSAVNPNIPAHVGLIIDVDGVDITTIEGNTTANDSSVTYYTVERKTFPWSVGRQSLVTIGFAEPEYD